MQKINVGDYTLTQITAPKRKQAIINNYLYSIKHYGLRTIYQAYVKPSYAKVQAYNYCARLCVALDGYDLTVVSFNCFKFTCSFEFIHPEHGNICYAYITDNGDYYVEA